MYVGLRFADDIGLLARSEPEWQDITTQNDEASRRFGPTINTEKIKTVMFEKTKAIELGYVSASKEKLLNQSNDLLT